MRFLLGLFLLFAQPSFSTPSHGDWIFSGGFGMTVFPTFMLLSPQLEYASKHNLYYGPLMQLGMGDGGTIMTGSAAARLILGEHPRVKPCIEGGVGLALGSNYFAKSFGVLFHAGLGFDYAIDRRLSLGTMIRGNIAPPLKSLFVSWPIVIARILL